MPAAPNRLMITLVWYRMLDSICAVGSHCAQSRLCSSPKHADTGQGNSSSNRTGLATALAGTQPTCARPLTVFSGRMWPLRRHGCRPTEWDADTVWG